MNYMIRKKHPDGRVSRVRKSQRAELVGVGAANPGDGGAPGVCLMLILDDDKQPRQLDLTIHPADCADPLLERLLERLQEMVNRTEVQADLEDLVKHAARALLARRFRHADYP